MTAFTVPLIVELCALNSRLGRSLSASDSFIVHVSPTPFEITIKTPVLSSDVSNSYDSAGGDRRKNPIQTP
jgi:hypothetical protein